MSTKKAKNESPTTEEKVVRLPLNEIHPYKGYSAMQGELPFSGQPFQVREDDPTMQELVERVKERGVRTPGIVRPDPEGGYELISGERRYIASQIANLENMPVIVRVMDDDEAVIELVDANIHRENISPTEKAWAYRMRLEAMKRQAGRPSKENASQVGTQKRSDQLLAEQVGESRNQIHRYIRLTELSPELQQMVDEKKISMTPAVELPYLKPGEQEMLITTMDYEQATPSLSQAQRLKKASKEGKLTEKSMLEIMSEEKKGDMDKLVLPADAIRKYFPRSYTPQRMQDTIIKLLEQW